MMKFRFPKVGIKKIISIIGAISILMASIPLSHIFTNAANAEGTSIDFEGKGASAIVEGNDAFSITGVDSEDKYYFYAKNNTSDTLTITFDNLQLDADKNYTVDLDVYTLRLSEDENNILFGLKAYGDTATAFESTVANDMICEEDWTNYHISFTANDDTDKLDFSLYTIGKVFIDNFVIIDENGNETPVDCETACQNTELINHFSMATLYDIAYEDPDIINGYLKAAVSENGNTAYNEGVNIPFNLDEPLTAGKYRIKVDLRFTALGSNRISFCASLACDDGTVKQSFLDAVDIELNKYNTYTFDIETDSENYNKFRFNVYQGCTAYIDNLILLDGAGREIINMNFDEPVNFSGSAYEQKGIAKTQAASAELYSLLSASTDSSGDYAIFTNGDTGDIYFHNYYWSTYADTPIPAGDYTLEIDVYALSIGNLTFKPHDSGWGAVGDQITWSLTETDLNTWVTAKFEGTTTGSGQINQIMIGSGFNGYIDNIKVTVGGNVLYEIAFTSSDLGKTGHESGRGAVTKLPTEIASVKPSDDNSEKTNYGILVDNSAGTGYDSFWMTALGFESPNLPAGTTYTVSYDWYGVTIGSPNNSSLRVGQAHWNTASVIAENDTIWYDLTTEIGKWTTIEKTITATGVIGAPYIYVGAGVKGYIDNFTIKDAQGNILKKVEFTAEDLNKNSNCATVVELPKATEDDQEINYGIIVDNSAGTGYDSFWMTALGFESPNLPAGTTYTVSYDWYGEKIGTTNNSNLRVGQAHWNTASVIAENDTIWYDLPTEAGKWTTIEKTITATGVIGAPYIYVGAGVKGYIDNFTIKDAQGNILKKVEFTAEDLNKNSNCATVVELPKISNDEEAEESLSGMNIAILRGRAGKNGASIKLGGTKSPLTLKSDTSYKLTFRYYQANPTNTGVLNLFGIDVGFDNDITYFKKNNTTGWATGYVYFTSGTVIDTSADWLEIILNGNAWVYFDDFKLVEQEIDYNKEVTVVDFEQKDDSIYPDATGENCTFGQTTSFSGTSNGSNGYFCATNSREYINEDKNSNQQYSFKGIKLKSYTTYEVSIDYYVTKPFSDYAFVVGYDATNTGSGSGKNWQIWGNNKQKVGWATESFTFTTGEVVPNASYITIVIYDVANSSNPRVIYFDNLTFTELYKVEASANDSGLGTVSKADTVIAGETAKVVANAYAGVTFEGWYEYGDLVSTDKIYRIENVDDNHKLVAHFSGEVEKPSHIIQGFEDYDVGDILYEYYEIVNDSTNVLEGKQSLHVKEDKIEVNADHSLFFPLVSDVETLLKDDTEYDIYIWVKPAKPAESTTYFQIVTASEIADMSDLLTSPGGTGMQLGLKPTANNALEEDNGWYKYLLGTVTTTHSTRRGFGVQVCKFHAFRGEGASIDDLYIDKIELVERVPDYANLKFTENLFNEITNSDFESEVTEENWAPLSAGLTVQKITDKEYEWQGNYNLKFDAAASNGEEYVRVIPISKTEKNYTFAAWTKLSEGSDITVGFYKNGRYETFENVVNGENGTLPLIADGKWNRVSFTFNSGDSTEGYIVIKGSKGTLELDMVELFFATRGYATDPNGYGVKNFTLEMYDPIAFPDVIKTTTTYIEDDSEDDSYIESDDEEDNDEQTEKKTKKKRVVRVVKKGGASPWVWVGVGAGALVLVAAIVVFIIVFKKRKQSKKEAE